MSGGTDPDGDCTADAQSTCKQDGFCDGKATPACQLYSGTTQCIAPSCNAMTLIQTSAGMCNGTGTCIAGMTTSCNGYGCGASACKTSCASSADCDGTHYCSNMMCVAKKAQGAACTLNEECALGQCKDGFCCDSACGGTCVACSMAKNGVANGQCLKIPLAGDPDNECNGASPICSGTMTPSCVACGSTLPATGVMCPAACKSCDMGTTTCIIECDASNQQCMMATKTCPPGWNCQVNCGRQDGCLKATIQCPADHACTVDCKGGGANKNSCKEAKVECKNGPCTINCHGGTTNPACEQSTVTCGDNACAAVCDASYNNMALFPTFMNQAASCGCTRCGGAC